VLFSLPVDNSSNLDLSTKLSGGRHSVTSSGSLDPCPFLLSSSDEVEVAFATM